MKAYVTLLSGSSYVPGALTLAKTLKSFNTPYKVVVLADTSTIGGHSLSLLNKAFDEIIQINDSKLLAPVEEVASKLNRSELSITFSKVLLWSLHDKYDQIVYLDCDTLPLNSLDHLFEQYKDIDVGEIVASPDIGWPDIFNSGVLILKPHAEVFSKLVEFSSTPSASFDGADQGLLNEFFHLSNSGHSWKRLPFVYNVTPSENYQYLPALHRFYDQIQLVHFIGATKPWHPGSIKDKFRELWWNKFNAYYKTESDRIQLLSNAEGEAASLKFTKLVNQWDTESELPAVDSLSVEDAPKIFPWEERDRIEPTRVFHPLGHHQSDDPAPPRTFVYEKGSPPASTSQPLKNAYHQFSDTTKFDPARSLDEVSKLPMKFLSRKKDDGKN